MIITCTILFWGCLGFLIPKKYMRIYMILASVGLSSLYFFFVPPVGYDLYRHYEVLHILRNNHLFSALSGALNQTHEALESYQQGSPVYLVYAYFISKLRIDQLLPVISSIIVYTSVSDIILMAADDIGEDIADWKVAFCFFFLLVMADYRTASGIRNMMAYALFAHVLYKDLVRNANKLYCFAAYIAIANIHNSVMILLTIRVLIELGRIVPKPVMAILALSAYSLIDSILVFLTRFSNVPMIQPLILKINLYGFGGGSNLVVSKSALRLIHIMIFLLLCLYCQRNIQHAKRFQKYGDVIILCGVFAIGSIRQVDIFLRSVIFIYFTLLPFLLLFLQDVVGDSPLWLNLPESSEIGFSEAVIYLMIYGAMISSLYLFYGGYYRPMDPGLISGFMRFIS